MFELFGECSNHSDDVWRAVLSCIILRDIWRAVLSNIILRDDHSTSPFQFWRKQPVSLVSNEYIFTYLHVHAYNILSKWP